MRRLTLYTELSIEACRQRLEAATEPPPSSMEHVAGSVWVRRDLEKRFRGRLVNDTFEIVAKRQSANSLVGSLKVKGWLERAGKGTTIVCELDDGFIVRLCAFVGLLLLICLVPDMHIGLFPKEPVLSWLTSLGMYGGGAFAVLFVLAPGMTRIEIGIMTKSLQEVLDAGTLIAES